MAKYSLKSHDDIEAVTTGQTFSALALARKRQLAAQLASATNELDTVFPVLLSQAQSTLEKNFLRAIVTVGDGTANTTPPSSPSLTGPSGTAAIPQGVDHVDVQFSPALASAPTPPVCSVKKGAEADDNISVVNVVNITANGFRAVLSSATENANYVLSFK